MRVNKYLVLVSGDMILMQEGVHVANLKSTEQYCNANMKHQLKYYPKDIQETASHIELIESYKDCL